MALPLVREQSDREVVAAPPVSFVALPEPVDLVAELIESSRLAGWAVEQQAPWTYLQPPVETRRTQGWKLHVSATVWSAPHVLHACMPVLLRARVPFKFASTADDVMKLNEFRCPRGNSGKFITVYPPDGSLRDLAEALHQATTGMAGPAILSDAPYVPGSLVHYRYGAFDGYPMLTYDGRYRDCILDLDTKPVEDQRLGVFSPPAWVSIPFDNAPAARLAGEAGGAGQSPTAGGAGQSPTAGGAGQSPTAGAKRMSVLLKGRYEVTAAVRHANKGGVYRARDRVGGVDVIVKEARPHVGTDREGRDARDYLRHEAVVLRHLAGLGIVPEVIDEFEQDGHVFLVEELLAGQRFRDRVDEVLNTGEGRLTPAESVDLAVRLARLLRTVHDHGVVIRDLTPNNLLAMPDGSVRLVDLELAAVRFGPAQPWSVLGIGSGTPGVCAPEQFACAAPDPRADLFSLGATLLHGVAHANPDLAEDVPATRPLETRIAELLALQPVPEPVGRIITGLMRTDPAERISLDEVIDLARAPLANTVYGSTAVTVCDWSPERWDALVQGILGHLAANAAPQPHTRPWPETDFGSRVEPCTVQHGSAGTLAVLARLVTCGVAGPVDRLVEVVLPRLTRHLDRERHRLPGLHFGFAGTAWALFDAGRALDRPDLVDRSIRLAGSLPTVWPNPDVTHGLAGLGICLLYLAEQTGDADLSRRAERCGESVLGAADPGTEEIFWTVPPSFDSQMAGYQSYGFAHGVAGIGTFLLAAAQATHREDFAAAARRCGQTLLAGAIHKNGAAYWPDKPGSSRLRVWWCNGSSGVGTFLCRLYAATGEASYREAAIAAAHAVLATRSQLGTPYCHGLAGNGDFLLDLAEATGDETFTDRAELLAGLLWARRVYRDGRVVLADETGKNVTGGFGVGLSGHLAFLTRLRFGGTRPFHPAVPVGVPRLS
jgi:hypothetical protein